SIASIAIATASQPYRRSWTEQFETIACSSATCERLSAGADAPKQPVYQDSYLTASPGPLSSGGCGWASPIVPGGRSLLICLVSTRWIVAANAAIIATATIIAKISKVIWVRRRLLQLRSLFMDNTSRGRNQRSCGEPVPLGFARRPLT